MPDRLRLGVAVAGGLAALVGRILMVVDGESYARRNPNAAPRPYRVDTGVVFVSALACGLLTLLLLLSVRVGPPDRVAVGTLIVFGVLTGLQVRALVRRARRKGASRRGGR